MKKNLLIFIFLFCGFHYIYGQVIKEICINCEKIEENGKPVEDEGVYDFVFFVEKVNDKLSVSVYSSMTDQCAFLADPNFKKQWKIFEKDVNTDFFGKMELFGQTYIGVGKESNEDKIWVFRYFSEFLQDISLSSFLVFYEPVKNTGDLNNGSLYRIISDEENEHKIINFFHYLRENVFEELK